LGELFALLAPVSWSIAVILFRRTGEVVPALALNLFKNALAIPLFLVTMLVLGIPVFWADATRADVWLLLASGVLGIGLADTFFFMTINRVGAGLQAIINTSYSPSIILLSVLFLGERLGPWQLAGVLLILVAVVSVSWFRAAAAPDLPKRTLLAGVACGVAASLTQGISVVMIKPLLEESPLLWANLWRLLGGFLFSLLLPFVWPGARAGLPTLRHPRIWRVMIPGSVMGTYVALMFWLAGMKFTQASTASALNQTASLWTFLLAVLILKEPATPMRWLGLAGGLVGVMMVTFG